MTGGHAGRGPVRVPAPAPGGHPSRLPLVPRGFCGMRAGARGACALYPAPLSRGPAPARPRSCALGLGRVRAAGAPVARVRPAPRRGLRAALGPVAALQAPVPAGCSACGLGGLSGGLRPPCGGGRPCRRRGRLRPSAPPPGPPGLSLRALRPLGAPALPPARGAVRACARPLRPAPRAWGHSRMAVKNGGLPQPYGCVNRWLTARGASHTRILPENGKTYRHRRCFSGLTGAIQRGLCPLFCR